MLAILTLQCKIGVRPDAEPHNSWKEMALREESDELEVLKPREKTHAV